MLTNPCRFGFDENNPLATSTFFLLGIHVEKPWFLLGQNIRTWVSLHHGSKRRWVVSWTSPSMLLKSVAIPVRTTVCCTNRLNLIHWCLHTSCHFLNRNPNFSRKNHVESSWCPIFQPPQPAFFVAPRVPCATRLSCRWHPPLLHQLKWAHPETEAQPWPSD